MQNGLAAADDERMARVVSALETHDALGMIGQPVDDLAFTFIAPLRADDDYVLAHMAQPLSTHGAFQRFAPRRAAASTFSITHFPLRCASCRSHATSLRASSCPGSSTTTRVPARRKA